MMLSPAEKQRRYRERQKQKREDSLREAGAPQTGWMKTDFASWVRDDGDYGTFDHVLALAGIEAPTFDDDSGPEAFVLNDATAGVDDPFGGASGSAGRAEVMVGCLIDAAVTLAGMINHYKKREIGNRIEEIEEADLSDPKKRKAALAEVVELNKLLAQLEKQVRWSFPQWKLKDD